MKNFIYSLLAGLIFLCACEDMNDKHDKYLSEGETVYIGKVDSVKTFAGDGRILFRYWLSDPRAKTLKIYWSNGKDSLIIPVASHAAKDSFETVIGSQRAITENHYTFRWIAWDDRGNSSVAFENNATVYGDRYRGRLTNKIVSSMETSGNSLTVNWAAPTNTDDIGVEIVYTDIAGNTVRRFIGNGEMRYEVLENNMAKNRYKSELEDVDFSKGVRYRTLYLPEPTAIDTFYTEPVPIEIRINVALGKNATSSDDLNASFPASNAVDGAFVDASRWVSGAAGEHWLEIDLGDEYAIDGFRTWNGSSGQFNTPIPKFDFQIWSGGAWVNLVSVEGNTDAMYAAVFEPVATSRVRFYSYSQTRLFEIAVYSTIR